MFIEPNNGETDVASNLLAIRRKRQILFLDTDSDFLKDFFGDPGVFASCIHQCAGNGGSFGPVNMVLHFASHAKRAHKFIL